MLSCVALAAAAGLTLPCDSKADSRPHVFVGEEKLDTLETPVREVRLAAERALEDDHWVMSKETTDRRLVTEWKGMRHVLARLVMGSVRARCVVDLAPLGEGRTEVRFRAALASDSPFEKGPNRSLVESAYGTAVKNFFRDLRANVSKRLDDMEEPTSSRDPEPVLPAATR